MSRRLNLLIAAGGTGGHLFPGLALAEALRDRGHGIQFAVRPGDVAANGLTERGFTFAPIPASGIPRRFSPLKAARALGQAALGIFRAARLIQWERFDGVVGMGGHLSFPLVAAARMLGVPSVLHEQNLSPGLANRLSAPLARAVAVSFPETARWFGGKSVVTGIPLRREFAQAPSREEARAEFGLDPVRPTLLVFGGSQGARALNEALAQSLPRILKALPNIQFLHLAGASGRAALAEAYADHAAPGRVLEGTPRMPSAYAAATVVLSRSGAGTIAELAAMKRRALLVPYPHAAGGHQDANAGLLARHGWAVVLKESRMIPETLSPLLERLFLQAAEGSPAPIPSDVMPDPLKAAGLLADLVEKTFLPSRR